MMALRIALALIIMAVGLTLVAATPSPSPTPTPTPSPTQTATPTPTPNPCVFNDLGRVSAGSSKSASGSWTSGCRSVNRAGRYARFYRFSLNARADIRIDLASATDSYLFLLSGAGAAGTSVEPSDLGAVVDNWTYGNARYSGFRRIHCT